MNPSDRPRIYRFGNGRADAGIAERPLIGGKAAALCSLTRAGFPVPPGFVIPTGYCRYALDHDGDLPPELAPRLDEALRWLEGTTGKTFGGEDDGLRVAVRSGAPESMPGMMDTVLNVGESPGGREAACIELRRAVADVFGSWNSPRAVAFRRHRGLPDEPGTAVTVQAMFPSVVSGVVFTRDPNGTIDDHMLVEAHVGLGDAVVSGTVTPHRLFLSRTPPHERLPAGDAGADRPGQALPLSGFGPLGALALAAENLFGAPQDIEWGWADGAFAILQSRPIGPTAFGGDAPRRSEISRLRAAAAGNRRVWVRHNLADTLSCPTPMTWDIVRHFMGGAGGFGLMYRDLGYRPSARVCREGFLELICGVPYADPERQAELFFDCFPLVYDCDRLRDDPGLLQGMPSRLDETRAGGRFLLALPAFALRLLTGWVRTRRARNKAARAFEDVLPGYVAYLDSLRDLDLSGLSLSELVAELHERRRRVLDDFGRESLKPGFFAASAADRLEEQCRLILGAEKGRRYVAELLGGSGAGCGSDATGRLREVARGEKTVAEFLDEFGHRAAGEMELSTPRWRENRAGIERLAAEMRERTEAKAPGIGAGSAGGLTDVSAVLAQAGASFLEPSIREAARECRHLLELRERARHHLMAGYELIRVVLVEIGRRTGLGDDVFYLRLSELDPADGGFERLREAIDERRARLVCFRRLTLPTVVDSEDLAGLGVASESDAGDALVGTVLAPGEACGVVRVMRSPADAGEAAAGTILVCPSPDPGWAPVLLQAGGLITETGGVLSHGAVLARELGLPAIVLPGATRSLRDGETVRLDGLRGLVSRVDGIEGATGGKTP